MDPALYFFLLESDLIYLIKILIKSSYQISIFLFQPQHLNTEAKRSNNKTIDSFFPTLSKKVCLPHEENENLPSNSSQTSNTLDTNDAVECSEGKEVSDNHSAIYDLGQYIGTPVDDLTEKNLILNPWVPPKNYGFPYSIRIKKEQRGKTLC